MKTNKVIWFTQGSNTIGIVLCTNEMGEKKAYIAVVDGADAELDEKTIKERGAKVHTSMVVEMYDHFFSNEESLS